MSGAAAEQQYDAAQQPAVDLMSHILQKGWQAGSVLGVGLIGPIAAYRFRKQGLLTVERMLNVYGRSAVGGLGLTGLLGAGMIWGKPIDQEGLEDRAYRLYYNEGQNRCDQASLVGLCIGVLAGSAAFLQPFRTLPVLGSTALGSAIGVGAHCASWQGAEKGLETGPNKMLQELTKD